MPPFTKYSRAEVSPRRERAPRRPPSAGPKLVLTRGRRRDGQTQARSRSGGDGTRWPDPEQDPGEEQTPLQRAGVSQAAAVSPEDVACLTMSAATGRPEGTGSGRSEGDVPAVTLSSNTQEERGEGRQRRKRKENRSFHLHRMVLFFYLFANVQCNGLKPSRGAAAAHTELQWHGASAGEPQHQRRPLNPKPHQGRLHTCPPRPPLPPTPPGHARRPPPSTHTFFFFFFKSPALGFSR